MNSTNSMLGKRKGNILNQSSRNVFATQISFNGGAGAPPLTSTNVQDAILEVQAGASTTETLQDAYDAGTDGIIELDPTIGLVHIKNDSTDNVDPLFKVSANNGTTNYLSVGEKVITGLSGSAITTGVEENICFGAAASSNNNVIMKCGRFGTLTCAGSNCAVGVNLNGTIGSNNVIFGVNNSGVNNLTSNILIGRNCTSNSTAQNNIVLGYNQRLGGTSANSILLGFGASGVDHILANNCIKIGPNTALDLIRGGWTFAIGQSISSSATSSQSCLFGILIDNLSGNYNVCMGTDISVNATESIAIGRNIHTASSRSVVIGKNCSASIDSISIGNGSGNTPGAQRNILIGTNNECFDASTVQSICLGQDNECDNYGISIGNACTGLNYAISCGYFNDVNVDNGIALGNYIQIDRTNVACIKTDRTSNFWIPSTGCPDSCFYLSSFSKGRINLQHTTFDYNTTLNKGNSWEFDLAIRVNYEAVYTPNLVHTFTEIANNVGITDNIYVHITAVVSRIDSATTAGRMTAFEADGICNWNGTTRTIIRQSYNDILHETPTSNSTWMAVNNSNCFFAVNGSNQLQIFVDYGDNLNTHDYYINMNIKVIKGNV